MISTSQVKFEKKIASYTHDRHDQIVIIDKNNKLSLPLMHLIRHSKQHGFNLASKPQKTVGQDGVIKPFIQRQDGHGEFRIPARNLHRTETTKPEMSSKTAKNGIHIT
jgi:hypothetical protein